MPAEQSDPPLVSLKITNPITYLKIWWKKIIGNEGVDLRFRIHPLTAIAITLVISGTSFGVGHFIFPLPFITQTPTPPSTPIQSGPTGGPIPTADLWKETAFKGTLHKSDLNRFYLLTTSSEGITLDLPGNIDLTKYVNKRILAFGSYNQKERVLKITQVSDLEVLASTPAPIPTTITTPTPSPTPT